MEVRVCLGCMTPDKDEKFKSIIQKNGKLAQLILELTNLKITNLKESPALLCSKCIKELKRANSFRKSIIKNYQKMFNSNLKVDEEIQTRLKIESEDLDPSEFIPKSFWNQTSDNLTTIDSELFQPEDPINENELEDSKIEVTLIKQEPIDDEQLDTKFSNSSTESESNDSTSDELPLNTFLKKQN